MNKCININKRLLFIKHVLFHPSSIMYCVLCSIHMLRSSQNKSKNKMEDPRVSKEESYATHLLTFQSKIRKCGRRYSAIERESIVYASMGLKRVLRAIEEGLILNWMAYILCSDYNEIECATIYLRAPLWAGICHRLYVDEVSTRRISWRIAERNYLKAIDCLGVEKAMNIYK